MICESRVDNSRNLSLHVDTNHEDKVYEYGHCAFVLRLTQHLTLHKKHNHEEAFTYEQQFLGCNYYLT